MCVVDREPVQRWLLDVAAENKDEYLHALLAGGRLHQVGHIPDEPDKILKAQARWTSMGQMRALETEFKTASHLHQLDDGCSYFIPRNMLHVFLNIRERGADPPLNVSFTFDTLSTCADTNGALASSVIAIERRRGVDFTSLLQPRFESQTLPPLALATLCEERDVFVSHSTVDTHGFGVFTERSQPARVWLFEFTGELKFVRDAKRLEDRDSLLEQQHVWRVDRQDRLWAAGSQCWSLVVDATVCGNQGRYVNSVADGSENTEAVLVTNGADPFPRLVFRTLKSIGRATELLCGRYRLNDERIHSSRIPWPSS